MRTDASISTEPRRRFLRWLTAPALAIAGVMVGSGPADASHDIVPVETREVFDVLRLRCAGSDGDVAQVACRWTMPDDAAGVKVLRVAVGSGQGRQTVFRTDDPSINRFVDSPVRRGVRYLYVVRAFDSAGILVAASRPAVAGVALAPEPTVEVLRLECTATGAVTARCRWSTPESRARVLTLWRSVDGGARERVASFGSPFPSSYGDTVPTSSSRAIYAVIATDGDGEIVARSRADGVAFSRPDDRDQRVVAIDRPVEPARPQPTVTTEPTPPVDERTTDPEVRPTTARDEPAPTAPVERPDPTNPTTTAAAATTPASEPSRSPESERPTSEDRTAGADRDDAGRDERGRAGEQERDG